MDSPSDINPPADGPRRVEATTPSDDPVAVEVVSTPSGATVRWTDATEPLGTTPLVLMVKAGDRPRTLLLTRSGYRDREVAFEPARAREAGALPVELTPLPSKQPKPTPKKGMDDL